MKSSDSDSECATQGNAEHDEDAAVVETTYVESAVKEELGLPGDAGQTEEFADENKSLVWTLVKQASPN